MKKHRTFPLDNCERSRILSTWFGESAIGIPVLCICVNEHKQDKTKANVPNHANVEHV